ncbi:MAG: hypothetical protein Q8P41_25115 [Pseudomonadota bacterium]|nr:hypothetical protein [Pseudomonadota bacterium]
MESYDAAFRAGLTVAPDAADDPAALAAAAATLPEPSAELLETLLFVAMPGEPVPERFRPAVERVGEPLWRATLLLPRQSHTGGGDIHPLRYAGSCRLNPALKGYVPEGWVLTAPEATAAFPPSDARWDAVVVAALLGEQPGQLTQDGTLRKDVERRIYTTLGGEPTRWALALQIARLVGLVRPAEGRLRGFPEAVPRPLGDPTALFADPLASAAASILLRQLGAGWLDLGAFLERLRVRCREILCSPTDGRYADRSAVTFDDAGWDQVEGALFHSVADTLHRAGVVDASRTGVDIRYLRRPGPRPSFSPGFVLLPDGNILVHSGELLSTEYGRLASLAPYVDGERMHRHRLTREGVAADLAAGHRDTLDFLASHSRTGMPPNIVDTVREWQRSATRITVLTGVDVQEDDDGKLSIAPPGAPGRVIDYTKPPRARFLYRKGRVTIPDGWDALGVRAAVERIARFVGREGDERIYLPERREHADVPALIARLQAFYGGELPGEIEALVISGTSLTPVHAERVWLVHLPTEIAGALRRDWIAGPILRRAVTQEEVVVAAEDLDRLRERLRELGIPWTDPSV